MPEQDDGKSAEIARLMGELADLSGEQEALEACRREAEEEEGAALVVAGVAVDLLSLETAPGERRETRALLQRLRGRLEAVGEWEAVRLLDAALVEGP